MGFVGLLQATAGGLGSILGHLRGTMRPSWALLGSSCTSWRRLGTVLVSILSQLSYLGGHLGTVWGRVGALWEPPWPTCGHLVGLLGLGGCRNSEMARTPTHIENIMIINQFTPPHHGRLEAIFGRLESFLGRLGGILEPFWTLVGVLGVLRAPWDRLGGHLGPP